MSVADNIRCLRPDLEIRYLMDNKFLPYGKLTFRQISTRVAYLIGKAIKAFSPDITVIACNTASTQVLQQLRAFHDHAFVGVVPAIKPAAEQTMSRSIAILATPATIDSHYLDQLITQFADGIEVTKIGSSALVGFAETVFWQRDYSSDMLDQILGEEKEVLLDCDHIVLGCTHFPFIREHLKTWLSTEVALLDSGQAIARRVNSLLLKHDLQTSVDETVAGDVCVYSTKQLAGREVELLLNKKIDLVKWLDW